MHRGHVGARWSRAVDAILGARTGRFTHLAVSPWQEQSVRLIVRRPVPSHEGIPCFPGMPGTHHGPSRRSSAT